MQAYSDPSRESDPYALPDVEVFQGSDYADGDLELESDKWYYWACFPGCLPDSDPIGPFDSEVEALADAREDGIADGDNLPCPKCGRISRLCDTDHELCHYACEYCESTFDINGKEIK